MSVGMLARRRVEYGDFQTPADLAAAVCRVLASERPATLIEPTCGTGTFLAAALSAFPEVGRVIGRDINARSVAAARRAVARASPAAPCQLRVGDFFRTDWSDLLAECAEPLLILGNPPWVTNSALGVLGSGNLPPKQNLPGRSGLEGLTGKSNFDVSEWMIGRLLEAAAGRRATLAMLCKTAAARRVLARAWETALPLASCEIRPIDAARHFGVRVDACLFICRTAAGPTGVAECRVTDDLESPPGPRAFGWRDGRLVADVAAYERVKHLLGGQARWRSGIKHDCSAVFEFREEGGQLVNGLDEAVDLEPDYLYPFLKSSDIGNVGAPAHVASNGRSAASHSTGGRCWFRNATSARRPTPLRSAPPKRGAISSGTPTASTAAPAVFTKSNRGSRSSASALTPSRPGRWRSPAFTKRRNSPRLDRAAAAPSSATTRAIFYPASRPALPGRSPAN